MHYLTAMRPGFLNTAILLGTLISAAFGRSGLARADSDVAPPKPADALKAEIYETARSDEKRNRLIGGSIGASVGITLFVGGALSSGSTGSPGDAAILMLAGASTAVFSLKNLFVPSPVEEFVTRYSKAPDAFEPEAFRYLEDVARRGRLWDGALSTGAGLLLVVSGAFPQQGSFLSVFSYVGGGMMMFGGISRLVFRSATERAVDRWSGLAPLLVPDHAGSVGAGLSFAQEF